MSKLYTEEQVMKAIKLAQKCESDCGGVYFDYGNASEIIEELTPIELPTDEEIWDESVEIYPYPNPLTVGLEVGTSMKRSYFTVGAKWMRDKISTTKLTETK